LILFFEQFFNRFKDFFFRLFGTDHLHFALALEPLDQRVRDSYKGVHSFLDGFRVVIHTTGALASGQSSVHHLFFRAFEEEHELNIAAFHHFLVPHVNILEIAGEAVHDMQATLALDVFLQQFDNQIRAH
jgi:hypothetical protein